MVTLTRRLRSESHGKAMATKWTALCSRRVAGRRRSRSCRRCGTVRRRESRQLRQHLDRRRRSRRLLDLQASPLRRLRKSQYRRLLRRNLAEGSRPRLSERHQRSPYAEVSASRTNTWLQILSHHLPGPHMPDLMRTPNARPARRRRVPSR